MWKRLVALVFVASVLATVLVLSKWQRPIEKISGFIEADEIRLGSRLGGRVAHVLVEEGETVETGQLLIELEPYDLNDREAAARARLARQKAELQRLQAGYREEEIAQAEQNYLQLKANFEKLRAGPRPQEIEAARARVKVADAQLQLAQQNHSRTSELYARAAEPKESLDAAIQQLDSARGDVAVSREELSLLEEGTRPEDVAAAKAQMEGALAAWQLTKNGYRAEDIAAAEAAVNEASASLDTILSQKRELQIMAPLDGVIESLDLRPGDLVGPNAPVMSMLDTATLRVRAYLPEDMPLEVGQRVPLSVDAFPDERFAAEVTFIASQAEFTPNNVQTPEDRSRLVFRVKILLREGQDRLRPGMIADVWFNDPGPTP